MKHSFYNNSRYFYLLLLVSIILFGYHCNAQMKQVAKYVEKPDDISQLKITVEFYGRGVTAFNLSDSLGHLFLEFRNNEESKATVVKSVPRVSENQQIVFMSAQIINGSIKSKPYHFLIDGSVSELKFEYKNGDIELLNMESNAELHALAASYYTGDLGKNFTAPKLIDLPAYSQINLSQRLDSVYTYHKKKGFTKDTVLLNQLNTLFYFDILQKIYPFDIKVDEFAKEEQSQVIDGPTIANFYHKYVTNHIALFDYENLNTKKLSKQYVNLISKGMYKFLLQPENVINPYYETAWEWLQATELYQSQKELITKNIALVKGEGLTKGLKNLSIWNESMYNYTLQDIVMLNQSDYYLLDFWATWCAPCIEGFRVLKELQLPHNLKVINLSVDRLTAREKWRDKSNEYGLENSYLIDQAKSADFLNVLQPEAIPRYILMDKDFNILNVDFFQPHEPNFLKYLKELTNSN